MRWFLFVAQDIGGMHSSHRRETAFSEPARGMVEGYGIHNRLGQPPGSQQTSAQFGVVRAEEFLLRLLEGDVIFAGMLNGASVSFAAISGQKKLPDIVQQS